jgi:hypothetical protein
MALSIAFFQKVLAGSSLINHHLKPPVMPALGQDKKHGKEGFYRNTSTLAIRLDKGPQSTGETGERS